MADSNAYLTRLRERLTTMPSGVAPTFDPADVSTACDEIERLTSFDEALSEATRDLAQTVCGVQLNEGPYDPAVTVYWIRRAVKEAAEIVPTEEAPDA